MKIYIDSPYSILSLEVNDNVSALDGLKRDLTVTIKKFTGMGKPQLDRVCLIMPNLAFRTGLLTRIRRLAPLHGLAISEEIDRRAMPKIDKSLSGKKVDLRDYQEEAVTKMLQYDMGVLCAATGSGKTHMAANMIAKRAVPTLFLVHTKELLYQTQKRFTELLGMKIGAIGDGVFEPEPITVATIQTLYSQGVNPGIKPQMVIVDETHHLPADMFFTVTSLYPVRYMYGLSATPYRLDGADLMIEAGAGPIIVSISVSDLIKRKILCKPVIRFIPIGTETSYSKAPKHYVVRKHIVNNEQRNNIIAVETKKCADKGQSVLIAVNWTEHAKQIEIKLKALEVDCEILEGKSPTYVRQRILKELQSKKLKVIISTIMKEGVDVPSLDVVINAAGGSDSMQLIGRALRKSDGKETATIIDFVDNQHITLLQASKNRMKRCQAEPEFLVIAA